LITSPRWTVKEGLAATPELGIGVGVAVSPGCVERQPEDNNENQRRKADTRRHSPLWFGLNFMALPPLSKDILCSYIRNFWRG
jgi:hypothetical protein